VRATRRWLFYSLAASIFARRAWAAGHSNSTHASTTSETTFVTCTHSSQSSYCAWWIKGAELCSRAFHRPLQIIQDEGTFDENTLNKLKAIAARTKYNLVLNVDAPHTSEFLTKLSNFCVEHEVYYVTQNNLACRMLPISRSDSYHVAHIDFDQKGAGARIAKQLLASLGGGGGIIALAARPDDRFSATRVSGLRTVFNPASKGYLLEEPVNAEWEASVAYDWSRALLAKHGKKIRGIWAANDDMALGAIEALKVYQRSVPVTGMDGLPQAIEAIRDGSLMATVAWDACWQGGIGLAIAYSAQMGLFDPRTLSRAHRTFYGPLPIITLDSVSEFLNYRDSENPPIDWNDFWGRSTGEIPDS
jgi:ribose transport system substrate-binding protein